MEVRQWVERRGIERRGKSKDKSKDKSKGNGFNAKGAKGAKFREEELGNDKDDAHP